MWEWYVWPGQPTINGTMHTDQIYVLFCFCLIKQMYMITVSISWEASLLSLWKIKYNKKKMRLFHHSITCCAGTYCLDDNVVIRDCREMQRTISVYCQTCATQKLWCWQSSQALVCSLCSYLRLDPPAPGPAAALVQSKTTAGGWCQIFPHSTPPPCCQYTTKLCSPPQALDTIPGQRLRSYSGN